MSRSDWSNKVVLVTGGSAGLGLSIASAFHHRGANVVLVGRDQSRLDAAFDSFGPSPQRVSTISADITKNAQVESMMQRTIETCHGLHVLVNCVGQSARSRLQQTGPDEFQQLWEINFLTAVRCTRAALPQLLQSRGHIVNIGSLASKVTSKYLSSYAASKHALAAYSQQLRLELGPQGLHTLLVCPGPILRDDRGTRYDQQALDLPPEARAPGAGVRLKGIKPTALARRIVRACDKKQAELVMPWQARLLFAIQQLTPRLGDWIVARKTAGPSE